ncbi:ATP-grasp fold amidoligase family protein [Sphingomonas sp.]|uniref:ATP-grasp fold amidoligase family protein n=1 Tax=Sphingomonas sp. TaxID=28214 RepID=UPI0025F919F5|nr:ATP-grasp fold amidoligase family protein [Sphingomonas sp.]
MNASVALAPPRLRGRSIDWARRRVELIYWWRHGRWPDLDAPTRFTEWVQRRKLHDRSLAFARLTDKLHSKVQAKAALGAEHVIPTLWHGTCLPAVAPWPFPFVVKANHGCNQFIVVSDLDDYVDAKRRSPGWLKRTYGEWLDEWHYRAAFRTLLVEPFVGGPGGELPLDYKVYVFGGRAEVVQLHEGRGGRHRWTQFDRDWRPLSVDPIAAPPTACLDQMLAAAELLAGNADFLRVDFYCVEDRLLFGEFCLYPGSGLDPFRPDSLDLMLGEKWTAATKKAEAFPPRPVPILIAEAA